MQKQAVEIKSDMLLAESRRIIDEKDVSLQLFMPVDCFKVYGKIFAPKYSR
jgi:hypothetical protein